MDASVITSSPSLKVVGSEPAVLPASALPIGETLKEYVITGIIGEGGFGIVYAARDTLLQRNVAIKEYMPAAIANRLASAKINLRSIRHQHTFEAGMQGFIDEARLLAQFKHAALVEILRFWEENGTAYMVMPHYSGKTLRNLLRQDRNQCSEAWLKSMLAPILDAIDLLHSNNIYHRDIAPDNIVIQDNGQPVLLDLGSARRVIAGMQSALTVVVKPGYAPIEQYTEDTVNEQGPWTDIYALGAVLYFAITGAAPSASVSRMMRDNLKILTTTEYPNYSEHFLGAINRALHLRPQDRFQSITEFREALNLSTAITGSLTTTPQLTKQAPSSSAQTSHDDDEITQILTEDEISQFKEKLLFTLSGASQQLLQSAVQHNTQPKLSALDENILRNNTKPVDSSISSFDDVKDLLEQKPATAPTIAKAITSPTNTSVEKKDTKINAASNLHNKKNSIKHPTIIIGFLLSSLVLVSIYLIATTSTDSDTLTAEAVETSNTTSTEERDNLNQESLAATPTTDEQATSIQVENAASQANVQPSTTAPSSESLGQQYPLEIAQANAQTTESITNEQQKDLTTEGVANIPTSNSTARASKNAKQLADNQNKTLSAAVFGVAKLTLVPWGEIWVDGQRYGVSPPVRELSLAPGTYRVELRNPGLPTEIRTLTFQPGENTAIHHNFNTPQQAAVLIANNEKASKPETARKNSAPNNKKPLTETEAKPVVEVTSPPTTPITTERALNIKVLPWGEIFLDGKMVGVTPPLHQIKLSPGAHVIEIRHPSYTSKTIQISASDPATAILEHHFK